MFNCQCRCRCTLSSIIISLIIGIIAAFLQITGTITATPVFLFVAFGISVVYLGILLLISNNAASEGCICICSAVNTLLIGILGTILFSAIILALGVVATSVISAILVGLLVLFLSLTFTSTACLVRTRIGCGD